jgi:hypothetical protein
MDPDPLLRLVGRFRRNRPYRVHEHCVIRLDRLARSPSMLKRPLVIIPPGLSTNPTHRPQEKLRRIAEAQKLVLPAS